MFRVEAYQTVIVIDIKFTASYNESNVSIPPNRNQLRQRTLPRTLWANEYGVLLNLKFSLPNWAYVLYGQLCHGTLAICLQI